MGRATIISGGTDGLYTVAVDTGTQRVQAEITKLNNRIASLEAEIDRAESEVATLESAEAQIEAAQSDAIDAYIAAAATGNTQALAQASEDLNAATAELYSAIGVTQAARIKLSGLQFDLRAARLDLAAKQAVSTTITREAWCADFTEDADGEVATLEIPGELGTLLIAPGGEQPAAEDGQLLARGAMTGPQAYFNAAVLPGWQKWMPDYRSGTVIGINYQEHTADVALDPLVSSAQGLPVNQADALSAVAVQYMECDSGAFRLDDRVVVKFVDRDWQLPRVIGFVDHPRTCCKVGFYFTVATGDLGTNYLANSVPFGQDWYAYDPARAQGILFNEYSYVEVPGYLVPVRSAIMTERTGQKVTNFSQLTADIIIRDVGDVDEGVYWECGPSSSFDAGAYGFAMLLYVAKAPALSRFLISDGWLTEFPSTDTDRNRFFVFHDWYEGAGFEVPASIRVEIGLSSQKVYINDKLLAELFASFPPEWLSLGSMTVLTVNDAANGGDLVNCQARWDYICVK